MAEKLRIRHRTSGTLIAEGPKGWGITPFEGAYYIRRKYLRTSGFKATLVPGICPYKFLYQWLDFVPDNGNGDRVKYFGWLYWLPNPLLPFIAFRVAVPREHPEIQVERVE